MTRDLNWCAAMFWAHLHRPVAMALVQELIVRFGAPATAHGFTSRSAARGVQNGTGFGRRASVSQAVVLRSQPR